MLDAFEQRLADVIADELDGVPELQWVMRPRSDLATDPGRVAIVIHTLSATADAAMGDDGRERRGQKGQYQLRTSIRLKGQAAVDAMISATGGVDLGERRRTAIQVLDRLLIAFQADAVRSGRAFRTEVDQGFELDGFRLAGIGTPERSVAGFSLPANYVGIRAVYDFSGRFWPVEAPLAGDHIGTLPTRLAVLPARIPDRVTARAGGPDVAIPIGLDLRAGIGATARVLARLKGASPPGNLVGIASDVPAGWVAFSPDPGGVVTIVYHPPATLATPARVRVAMALDRPDRPSIRIAELAIEVAGS